VPGASPSGSGTRCAHDPPRIAAAAAPIYQVQCGKHKLFWTAMPKSPIDPTGDETRHVSPSSNRPPPNATGMVTRMTAASAKESRAIFDSKSASG